MATSNTYNFQSVEIEALIRDSYENIGIAPEFITPQKLDSARRSINLLLIEWMNKSTNLWTLQNSFLGLNEFQTTYNLPSYVSNITEVNLRTSIRQLNGTAISSSGGVADNAFDDNPLTTCTQDEANGSISYDYGENTPQNIVFLGIKSNITRTYSLTVVGANDVGEPKTLLQIPAQLYNKGEIYWFDIPAPINARIYRIEEIGNAILDIQEIYFNNNVIDTVLGNISRSEYLTLPEKHNISRPSTYYFKRDITPSLFIWPAPSSLYNSIFYSYKKMMQDVGLYTNNIEIPARFYPALVTGLSFKLALKFNNQMSDMLNQEYQNSFQLASVEDNDSTLPISITPNFFN